MRLKEALLGDPTTFPPLPRSPPSATCPSPPRCGVCAPRPLPVLGRRLAAQAAGARGLGFLFPVRPGKGRLGVRVPAPPPSADARGVDPDVALISNPKEQGHRKHAAARKAREDTASVSLFSQSPPPSSFFFLFTLPSLCSFWEWRTH